MAAIPRLLCTGFLLLLASVLGQAIPAAAAESSETIPTMLVQFRPHSPVYEVEVPSAATPAMTFSSPQYHLILREGSVSDQDAVAVLLSDPEAPPGRLLLGSYPSPKTLQGSRYRLRSR